MISVLLALGVAVLVLAGLVSDDDPGDVVVESNPAVVELLPPRGDRVLHQAEVGVVLAPGWSGELLHIGGTVIPLDQQQVRPALNSVTFRPTQGSALESLPPQEVCASVRYWPTQAPDRTGTIDWCFRVDG